MNTNTALMTRVNQSLSSIDELKKQIRGLQEDIRTEQSRVFLAVMEDEMMMDRIIMNLPPSVLINAIKKSERGVRLKVRD